MEAEANDELVLQPDGLTEKLQEVLQQSCLPLSSRASKSANLT